MKGITFFVTKRGGDCDDCFAGHGQERKKRPQGGGSKVKRSVTHSGGVSDGRVEVGSGKFGNDKPGA